MEWLGERLLNKMQYACVESNKSIHGTIETLPDIENHVISKSKKGDSGKKLVLFKEFFSRSKLL